VLDDQRPSVGITTDARRVSGLRAVGMSHGV